MSRFVAPETHVLPISQGDTLIVKRRLNAGEQRAAFARMAMFTPEGERRVDRLQVGLSMMVAYLLDWSLKDTQGQIVPIRGQSPETVAAALEALDPESFEEIKDVIELYDASVRTAREQEKNGQDGANGLPAISPSPVDATGATSGSQSSTLTSTTSL